MFNIGDKVELIDTEKARGRESEAYEQYGVIEDIFKNFILIKLPNYRTCANKANIGTDGNFKLLVKNGDTWVDIGREALNDIGTVGANKTRKPFRKFKSINRRLLRVK
ncbi:TPA: hypothetical protein I9Z77_001354 [Clostridium perfringens]|nr:hypothetical protein [Clostridium perfringens]